MYSKFSISLQSKLIENLECFVIVLYTQINLGANLLMHHDIRLKYIKNRPVRKCCRFYQHRVAMCAHVLQGYRYH